MSRPKPPTPDVDYRDGTPPSCDRLWTVNDVSEFLGVPVSTLHQWRYHGTGPAAFRVGKHLRYDPNIVRRWLVEHCSGVA